MSNWEVLIFGFALFAAAFVIALISVAFILRGSSRFRALAYPNERSSHRHPTPSSGGLAIAGVSIAGIAAIAILPRLGILAWMERSTYWWLFALAALAVAAVGWFDDLHDLNPHFRLVVQAAAAAVVILAFGPAGAIELPGIGLLALGGSAWPVVFVWFVGLTNAFNFMDGIDGIAGCQGVAAGLGWTALGALQNLPAVAAFGLLLAGSSLGFLAWNWPPAKIFMGDVGSTFLGFSFAALPLLADPGHPRLFLAGVLFVWPFVFDSAFTVMRRLRRGENILRAHRSHLYQRLVVAGWSHRAVTLLYAGLAAVGGVLAVAYTERWPGSDWAAILTPPALFAGLWVLVCAREKRTAAANGPNSPDS
jgi:UDP-N-acetylmuramyl pentapeptide phosphotransferase/UDP-N-acetylglucosamine-1-phosphate transferase